MTRNRDPKWFLFPPSKGTVPAVGGPCLLQWCPQFSAGKSTARPHIQGFSSTIPSCEKVLGWDSCQAELICTLSCPRPAVPHRPGFLSVRGVRARQALWKALLPPKAHKGTSQLTETALKHTWNRAVMLDNPNPGLCDPHILPEGTQVQLYQHSSHQRLLYPLLSCPQKPPEWLLVWTKSRCIFITLICIPEGCASPRPKKFHARTEKSTVHKLLFI